MKISVIGAGSWGQTSEVLLAENGHDVKLWVREQEIFDGINKERENKFFLPGIKIPDNVTVSTSLEIIKDSDMIVTAMPSNFVRDMAKKIKPYLNNGAIVVSLSKGFEKGTFKRNSEVLKEELGNVKIAALSGPNHAEEVAKKVPAATAIASDDTECLEIIKKAYLRPYFKVYIIKDIIGLEVGGAMKNITAIAVGICDALGLGDNAKASIITLGLSEMINIGKELGGKLSTFTGLPGIGDLIATCTSEHSRNRKVGKLMVKGMNFEQIKAEMKGMVAEGVIATKNVYEFAQSKGLGLPLTTQMYKVLYEDKGLEKAKNDLLNLI